jgi:hypothetical protein
MGDIKEVTNDTKIHPLLQGYVALLNSFVYLQSHSCLTMYRMHTPAQYGKNLEDRRKEVGSYR